MNQRRQFSPEQKAEVVLSHLIDQTPIFEVCERHQINVNMFYRWQAEFRANAVAAFQKPNTRKQQAERRKSEQLKKQIQQKDSIIAYVTTELVKDRTGEGHSDHGWDIHADNASSRGVDESLSEGRHGDDRKRCIFEPSGSNATTGKMPEFSRNRPVWTRRPGGVGAPVDLHGSIGATRLCDLSHFKVEHIIDYPFLISLSYNYS